MENLEDICGQGLQSLIEEFLAVLPELSKKDIERICGDRCMPRSIIAYWVQIQNEMGRAYLMNYLEMTLLAKPGRGIGIRVLGAVRQVLMWGA